ncbi:MAG: PD-(D/E)XK nuclease family protein [Candidatus Hodarchaeota archaeon]
MEKLKEYRNLLSSYLEVQRRIVRYNVELFQNLLESYLACYQVYFEKNRALTPNFNPLDLLNLKYDELTHSNILGWAFDPYGTHNQGDLFFKNFLEFFHFKVFYKNWDYKVRREYSGHESIIDILVYGKNFIFYIENKTLTPEGYDQTDREYRDLMRLSKALNIRGENIFPIFLSPTGEKPRNENWIPISYYQLAKTFEKALSQIRANYVQLFMKSWLTTLKSLEV